MNKYNEIRVAYLVAVLTGFGIAIYSGYLHYPRTASLSTASKNTINENKPAYRNGSYTFEYSSESDIMAKGQLSQILGPKNKNKGPDKVAVIANGAMTIDLSHFNARFTLENISLSIAVNGRPVPTSDLATKLTGLSGTLTKQGKLKLDNASLDSDKIALNLTKQLLEVAISTPSISAKDSTGRSKDSSGPYHFTISRKNEGESTTISEQRRYQPRQNTYLRDTRPKKATRGTVKTLARYSGLPTKIKVEQQSTMSHYLGRNIVAKESREVSLTFRHGITRPMTLAHKKAFNTVDQSNRHHIPSTQQNGATVSEALTTLESLSKDSSKNDITESYLRIKKILNHDASFAKKLEPYALESDDSSLAFRMAVLALGTVGDSTSQAVLAKAMNARIDNWPAFQQISLALAHVEQPDTKSVESIWEAHKTATSKDAADHALFAYGSILRGLNTQHTDKITIEKGLANITNYLRDDSMQLRAVIALGNFGHESLEKILTPFFESKNLKLRTEAIAALRFVSTSSAGQRLLRSLSKDLPEDIRLTAARSLQKRVIDTLDVDRIFDALNNESSLIVQKAIITALALNISESNRIKAKLIDQMSKDIPTEIHQFIEKILT